LPGGFATKQESGFISVIPSGPIDENLLTEITMTVLDSEGVETNSLDFNTEQATSGFDKKTIRTTGRELLVGSMTYEFRFSPDDKASSLDLTHINITGKRPRDILPGLRFIAARKPTRTIQIDIKDGPPLARASIPGELLSEIEGNRMIAACEALAVIQTKVSVRIVVPDLATTTWDTFYQWLNAAALIRGDELNGKWTEVKFHLAPGATLPQHDVGPLIARTPCQVQVGDNVYKIGEVETYFASASQDKTRPVEQHDDHLDAWYVPSGSETMKMRMVPKQRKP
jgi:hypothetical protein